MECSLCTHARTIVVDISTDHPLQSQVQSIYEETFLHDGRLSNIVQVLAFHPSYLTRFTKTHDFLMDGNGPLPHHIRNYIAILVSEGGLLCSALV